LEDYKANNNYLKSQNINLTKTMQLTEKEISTQKYDLLNSMDKLSVEKNNENHENNLLIIRLKEIENNLIDENNTKNDLINHTTLEKNNLASELEN
jgi:hypothetical protein